MKEIKLTQGKFALVDDEDFDYLNQFKWFALKNCKTYYAAREIRLANGKQRMIWMHRDILKPDDGVPVDHFDRNGLHNQRKNIRIADKWINAQNQGLKENNTSGYSGVSWQPSRRKWRVLIMVNRKNKWIGRFDSLEEAVAAREKAKRIYHPYCFSEHAA